MCEFLIKAIDAHYTAMPGSTETEAEIMAKDLAGCYKEDDIISVKPDGSNWGKNECLPKFLVVSIPEMTVDDGRKYCDKVMSAVDPITGRADILIRRKYKFDYKKHLTPAKLASIKANPWYVEPIEESKIEDKTQE